MAASAAALLTDEAGAGAAREEEGAVDVLAEVVDGLVAGVIDERGLVGLITEGLAGKDAREGVEDARVERRSDEVEAVFAWAVVRELVPLVPEAVPESVDMRFESPFIAFLASSPDVRLALPSWSDVAPFAVVAGRLAVVVPAVGLAGGLVKLLPMVGRVVELDFCADEAVPTIADERADVAAVGRLGAAEVAGVAFLAGGMFSAFFDAEAAAVAASGFFGVSTFSGGASVASGLMVVAAASGSAIVGTE